MGGLKTGPSRRHRIQPAEGPVLDPRVKETCFKKGQKVDPLEIKSGPPWRVQFWSLFDPFIVANLLKRLFQIEADLTCNSCGWNLELFEALIANSILVCVRLMCFYIGNSAAEEGAWVGLKPDLQGGTGFNLLRVQFWTPV